VLLLEDLWRIRSREEQDVFFSLAGTVSELVENGKERLLAMLVDAFYHHQVHLGPAYNVPGADRTTTAADLTLNDIEPQLQSAIDKKSGLRESRIERFDLLVRQIAQGLDDEDEFSETGEPELLGMLLADFLDGHLRVDPPSEHIATHPQAGSAARKHRGSRSDRRKKRPPHKKRSRR
jgi:hypothetical protein